MNYDEIKNIDNIDDFVRLLNYSKNELFGKASYPFKTKQIAHYAFGQGKAYRYKSFSIPKRNGSNRAIKAPAKGLKIIQRCINNILVNLYNPDDCVMGFVKGVSITTNANTHVGQKYVYCIDLTDFFTSIKSSWVYHKLCSGPFNIHPKIAGLITDLCCDNNCLPQGAPTSPILANITCERIDSKIKMLSSKYNVKYTRYADDMTFSSNKSMFHQDGLFLKILERIIIEEGFNINTKKTRLLSQNDRQLVTGLIVNKKVNVSAKYVKQVRTMIHNWEVNGYDEAQKIFLSHYKPRRHEFSEHYIENIIEGKLNYLKMVKGGSDPTYATLKKRFLLLCKKDQLNHKTSKSGAEHLYVSPKGTCLKDKIINFLFKQGENVKVDLIPKKWTLKLQYVFPKEVVNLIKSNIVESSDYGLSVRFILMDGSYCFIPLSPESKYYLGSTIDLDFATVKILSIKGGKDILRIDNTPIQFEKDATGYYILGENLLWGKDGFLPQKNEALYYFKKSAELGDSNGQMRLGELYFEEKKYDLAFFWMEKSASQNNKIGHRYLGRYYFEGTGCPVDYVLSYYHYQKALLLGDEKSKLCLDELIDKIKFSAITNISEIRLLNQQEKKKASNPAKITIHNQKLCCKFTNKFHFPSYIPLYEKSKLREGDYFSTDEAIVVVFSTKGKSSIQIMI